MKTKRVKNKQRDDLQTFNINIGNFYNIKVAFYDLWISFFYPDSEVNRSL